jgi:vacuolar-type H+-ATPase subunit I/STV1
MSIAIDNFTKQLHDNLEAVEARAQAIKDSIQSAPRKTQAEIQAKLDEAKKTLEAKKAEFETYRSTLKAQLDEKESEIKDNVEGWKHNREVKKLEYRADRAELYASTTITFALAAMEQAEEATLAAIAARFDAEATEN